MNGNKMTLKVLRTISGLTQEQVADAVKVNRITYSRWERYEAYPDVRQFFRLAEVFNCSLDDFYFPIDTSQKLAE